MTVSIFILLISSAVFAQSVKPGIWQADSKFSVSGIPLPSSQDQECLSADQARDLKATLTKELDSKGCRVTKWLAKTKTIQVSLKCSKSGLDATGNLHGTITEKSYDLAGNAEGTYNGIPAEANISLKGKWLKDCNN